MSSQSNINNIIINQLSESKYNQITPEEGEFYCTPDTNIATKDWTESRINDIMNNLYPVGSTYITTASTCPLATLISGSTWTKIEDKFLLSSGTKNVNETGGSETNTLTMGNMPDRVVKMVHNGTGSAKSGYSMMSCAELGNKSVANNAWGHVDSIDGRNYGMDDSGLASGQAVNNMPPYIVVNVFQRTA